MSLTLIFYIISFIAVASALLVVLNRNAVYSVIFLILTFFSLASLFLLLGAYFLAVLEILIYAGAIMVLFLFVIMLLNVSREDALPRLVQLKRGLSLLLIIVFFLGLTLIIIQGTPIHPGPRVVGTHGSVAALGEALFSKYLFPFEVASLLLFVALIGTVYLAKRKI
ncbi:MAG: NADH-quinone oxidoreductase subunit J [Candidatus Neomarinimicrobiota bacterium]